MNRILFAVLLAAAPAFADRSDRPSDEGDWSGGYGDEQYQWPQSDGTEGNWQSAEDVAYAAESGPTLDDFRNDSELSWNGEWMDTGEYGRVWRPTHVSEDWQPYLYGRWVWTRAGWAWASDEPFGWAVYHYGRWAWSPAAGWMWVPGSTWAPAWVSWRWTDGYAAWCPLGPRSVVVDRPALWVVVPTRHFLEPVRHNVVPRPQRQVLPLPSRPGPSAGPAVAVVERAIGRTVRPLAIGHAATPSSARAGSGSVDFYRPRTSPVAVQPRAVVPAQPQPPRTASQGPRGERPTGYYASPPVAQPQAQPRPHLSVGPGQRPPQPQSGGQGAQAQVPAQAPRAQPPAQGPRLVVPRPAPQAPSGNAQAPQASAPKSTPEQPLVKER